MSNKASTPANASPLTVKEAEQPDILHKIGLFCFLYGQRGSVCGGAGFIAHRLSFP